MKNKERSTEWAKRVDQECHFSKIRILDRFITRCFERRLAAPGPSISQFHLMSAIICMGAQASASLLSRFLYLEKSSVSREIARLVALDWIEESQDPADIRRNLLSLSAKGRQQFLSAQLAWEEAQKEVEAFLPAVARQGFIVGAAALQREACRAG